MHSERPRTALDVDVAQLQTDLATYLGAGGSARNFIYWLELKLMNTTGHKGAMLNVIVRGRKGRPSPAALDKTLAALTPGAVYP